MSLNVKDPEAHRLAQRIAKETGSTITRVVIEALREKLERIGGGDPQQLADEIRAIAGRAAPHVKRPFGDHADFLYDAQGLPK
jgi:antitoxin VapB